MALKPIPQVTADQEALRAVELPAEPGSGVRLMTLRRDPVEPLPVGSYIVEVFKIVGYRPDCDGTLIAQVVGVDRYGAPGDVPEDALLHPDYTLQIDHPSELWPQSPAPGDL